MGGMAYSGGSLVQPAAAAEDAGTGRVSLLAMEVMASVCPGRSLRSMPWNNGGLDVAVSVEHVAEHIMQAGERSFTSNVIRASNFLLRNQCKSPPHRLGGVMERGLQRNLGIMQPIRIQLHLAAAGASAKEIDGAA